MANPWDVVGTDDSKENPFDVVTVEGDKGSGWDVVPETPASQPFPTKALIPLAQNLWHDTPMGRLNDAVNSRITPAIQSGKEAIRGGLEWAGLTPSEEELDWGVATPGQMATKVIGDTVLDQIPESTYGIAGAIAIPKAINAAAGAAVRRLPILGKSLGELARGPQPIPRVELPDTAFPAANQPPLALPPGEPTPTPALPAPVLRQGDGWTVADEPNLAAVQNPAPPAVPLPARNAPTGMVPYRQNPLERAGQEAAGEQMAYDEALSRMPNRPVPEYEPFTPETRHTYTEAEPRSIQEPQASVGQEPVAPLRGVARTEDDLRLQENLAEKPNDPNRQPAPPLDPYPAAREYERTLPPDDAALIQGARNRLAGTESTARLYKDPETRQYTPERAAIHEQIKSLPEFTDPKTIAKPGEAPVARLVIGPPGAGKTTAIQKIFSPEDLRKSVVLDNDEIKALLPDYDSHAAGSFHEEATDIHRSIEENLARNNQNFIDQIIGRSADQLQKRIQALKALGYKVELYLMDVDPKLAASRALNRYKETGRFVDPRYILDEVGLKPRQTYDRLKAEVDNYGHYQTDVEPSQAPREIESTLRRGQVLQRPGGLPGQDAQRGPGASPEGTPSTAKPNLEVVKPEDVPPANLDNLYPQKPTGTEGFLRVATAAPEETAAKEASVLKRQVYDRFEPIKYQEGKEIAPEFPQAGGKYTQSYVEARTLGGRIKAKGEALLEDLNQTLEPLKNFKDREILNRIYTLRNFSDLDLIGKRTSGVSAPQAQAELARLRSEIGDERFDRISKVADAIADIQNNKGLDLLVEGKVITPEAAEAYRQKYPNYLRSEIVEQDLAGEHPELRSSPRDNPEPLGKVNRSMLKPKQGTDKIINTDVIDVVRRSLLSKVAAAEKQKTIDVIAKEFGKPIGNRIMRGSQLVAEYSPEAIPKGWVRSNIRSSNNRVYAVRQDVEDMLQGLNREQMDLVTKTMASFNRVFKGGATTYRAPFVLSNLFRDAQEFLLKARSVPGDGNKVAAYLKGTYAAVQDALHEAFPKFVPENGLAKAWKEQGGAFGGVVTSIGHAKPIPIRLINGKEQIVRFLGHALMLPVEPIRMPAEILENATRLAEYARLQPTKLPEQLKILNSRDVTVDFEKMGDALRIWNNAIPFLNPTVQGTLNIARAVRDQPIISAGKATAYIVVPQLALYNYNRKFENDDLIDPYIKDNFWYVNSGATKEVNGRQVPVIWTIRKGEAAQLFSNPVRRALEYYSKDPNFQNAMDDYNWQGIANSVVSTVAPPLLKVPFEEAANYDTFKKGQIVPERMKDVKASEQFSSGTTNTARILGKKLGVSPLRLEHIAQGAYPASRQFMEASDLALEGQGIQPTIPRKDKDALERSRTFQPFLRTPSGYFSQEEDAAKRFEQKTKEAQRTPAVQYEEARRRYLETRNQADLDRMIELSREVPGDTRMRINQNLNRQMRLQSMKPEDRAVMSLPVKHRKLFRSERQQ